MHAVALEVVIRAGWAVNRDFVEIRPAQSADLGIGIREQTPLQQWVIAEIDARHHVARMESYLLGFCKVVVRVAVKHHFADDFDRHQLLRDQLGGVEQVKIKFEFILFRDQLHAQLILWVIPGFNRFP